MNTQREYLPKKVASINVTTVPYTVTFTEPDTVTGLTTISMGDSRIVDTVKFYNALIASQLELTQNGICNIYKKTNVSLTFRDYASIDDLFSNYSTVGVKTKEVSAEILNGTDQSKTVCGAQFLLGENLTQFFTDIEYMCIKNAINGGMEIPTDASGNNLTVAEIDTVINGKKWDNFNTFRSMATLNKSDWDVLGYYYGRHESDPMYNVFDSGKFADVAAMQAQRLVDSTDSSGVVHSQYVTETLTDAVKKNIYSSVNFTITQVSSTSVIASQYIPEVLPVCLTFNYCFLEHYTVGTSGKPLLTNNFYTKLSSTQFANGTKGCPLKSSSSGATAYNLFKCKTYYIKVYTRVSECMHKYLIIDGYASVNDNLYTTGFVTKIKSNIAIHTAETFTGSNGSCSTNIFTSASSQDWFIGNCGVDNRTAARCGCAVLTWNTSNPQLDTIPSNWSGFVLHEIYGHGVDGATINRNTDVEYLQNTISASWINLEESTQILDKGYSWQDFRFYRPSFACVSEGFATLMEILGVNYGLLPSMDLAKTSYFKDSSGVVLRDYVAELYAIFNLARLGARSMVCASISDPSSSAGKGDCSTGAWCHRTILNSVAQFDTDYWRRLILTQSQQSTYSVGLLSNIACISIIKKKITDYNNTNSTSLVFSQGQYNYWRMYVSNIYLGESLNTLATLKFDADHTYFCI